MKKKILLGIFILMISNMYSQNVSGNVTSNTGPLPGVNILVKGANNGAQTDFDGNYRIDKVNAKSVLVISYLGFKTQEILVGDRTEINVNLEESKNNLDEVILIGYNQSQSKRTLSTAISTVSTKQIEDLPVSRVENILQGAVAGVIVQQSSGAPGSSSSVRIRGVGSPNNSDPLYLVDGFPVPDIQHLSPEDIEELTVLKDAASIAIYGSRGSNGVILVKTKSGRRNSKQVISITGYSGFQFLVNKPDLLNGPQYIEYYNQGVAEVGGTPSISRGAFTEAEKNILPDNDWYDIISRDAAISNLAASVSGGGEKYSYSISGSTFDQEGIISKAGNSSYNRKNLKTSFNADVRENFQIGVSASVSKAVNLNPINGVGSINSLPAIYPTHAENGEVFNPSRPNNEYKGVPLNVVGEMTNPVWERNEFGGSEEINDIINYGISGDWQPIKDLDLHAAYSYYRNDGLSRSFTPSLGAVYPTQQFFLQGRYSESPSRFDRDQITTTAAYTFSKLAPKGHHLDVLVGYEVIEEKRNFDQNTTNVSDYLTTDFDAANFALATDRLGADFTPASITERGLVSYIGRVKYDFRRKYLATASFRNDASSTFGQNFQSGFFPSFSLGWVLSEENFLNNSSWMNLLKLRSSWGITGTDASSGYAYLSTLNSNVRYGDNAGLSLTRLANPDLRWEEIEQYNVGIDLTAFNNTFNLSFDYYSKETTDILLESNTPASSGLSPALVNVGAVKNSGLEMELSYKKYSDKFSWNASLNIGYNKNEVTDLGNNGKDIQGGFTGAFFSDPITRTSIGKPIGSFYGYVTEGLDADGNLIFKDLDGSGNNKRFPEATDKTFIGKPTPDLTSGLTLGASYSGFDLSAFFYGSVGNDVFEGTIRYTAISSNRPASYLQEGAPRNIAVAAAGDTNGEELVSDFHVKDASFIKLKNVVFGYSLPENVVNKINVDKIRVYISGQNLFTLTKYPGIDPEVGGGILNSGIDTGFYPQSRSFLLGFQINL